MSVHSDWWLYPNGSCQEMGGSEHGAVALHTMMKLDPDERVSNRQVFNGLEAFTPEQIQRARDKGVPENVFRFLSSHSPDPRYYAIKNYGWIRVAKSNLNVWMWDDETISTIRGSSYWSQQPAVIPADMFDVTCLLDDYKFSITVAKIFGGDNLGEAVAEPEVEKIYVGPRRGMHTDTGAKSNWQYRRIGDNRRR